MHFSERYGPWALILGGSEGIGRAMANEAARRGLNVAMVARRRPPLEETARAIADRFGVETMPIVCDLGQPDTVTETVAQALAERQVGLVIYNAAAEPRGMYHMLPQEMLRNNIDVNVLTPTLLLQPFARAMVGRGHGGIVLCTSIAAMQGIYSYVTYGAAKAYAMIMGEGLWDELGQYGVDACTLMIGATYTPNFIASQRAKGTVFAESRTPPGLAAGVPIPQEPQAAAARLFEQIEGEWQPLIYANPEDEQRAQSLAGLSRGQRIKRIGDAMRSGFRTAMGPGED